MERRIKKPLSSRKINKELFVMVIVETEKADYKG